MKWPWRELRPTIFTRTYLLVFAALLVAEGISIALLISSPPPYNAPMSLSRAARLLQSTADASFSGHSGATAPPDGPTGAPGPTGPDPTDSRAPTGAGPTDSSAPTAPDPTAPRPTDSRPTGPSLADSRPPGGPRPPWDSHDRPPLPPAGNDLAFSEDGPPGPPPGAGLPGNPGREWQLLESPAAPAAPADADLQTSSQLRDQLAALLGVEAGRVRVFVRRPTLFHPTPPTGPDRLPALGEGFIVAVQADGGRWKVLESVVDFPNAFQRQALWLFVLGSIVLLPLAWLFAQALSAPIRRFAEAARRLGNDPTAAPLRREGAAEMLAAVDAFNTMQQRLNRLVRERTQMIGAIAHDLRTPLTRLAFRLNDLPSPLRDKVDADLQEMKSMISAALDFIRERSQSGPRQRLDFRLLVESVVDDHSDLGHDITLEPGRPITLNGDPLALRRMVGNLVDNALKYGERARLRLKLDEDRCTLEIDDAGPGIPEHLQQQVFEPFFRAEGSRNRDTGGIGLGLAAVRAIVLDHGGDIALRNLAAGGLRVSVSLPMAES